MISLTHFQVKELQITLDCYCHSFPGQGGALGVESNPGFMGQSVDSVVLAMTSFLADADRLNQLDPAVAPVPWRPEMFSVAKKRHLRIGWYDDDGFLPVVPGCKRALHQVIKVRKKPNSYTFNPSSGRS